MTTTLEQEHRYTRTLFRRVRKLADECSKGNAAACIAYNRVVVNLRPPFYLYRGVDAGLALEDLRRGYIGPGYLRSSITFFSLDFDYASRYATIEGIVYGVKVSRELVALFAPVLYEPGRERTGITSH